jgi:hypothetical protein
MKTYMALALVAIGLCQVSHAHSVAHDQLTTRNENTSPRIRQSFLSICLSNLDMRLAERRRNVSDEVRQRYLENCINYYKADPTRLYSEQPHQEVQFADVQQ